MDNHNQLRELVKEQGLNHRQLAKKIGVDSSYMSRIINGKVSKNNFARKYLQKVLEDGSKELMSDE